MPLKMGAPRTLDPERVKQLIEDIKKTQGGNWTYSQLAKILSQELGTTVTADGVSKCARRNGIIGSKSPGPQIGSSIRKSDPIRNPLKT